jgi:hypothetical protein
MAQSYRRGPQRVQSGSSNNMDGTTTGTAISKGQCVSFERASMGAGAGAALRDCDPVYDRCGSIVLKKSPKRNCGIRI